VKPGPGKTLMKNLRKYFKSVKKGIDIKDFERVKKKYIGEFIRGFNSLEFIATLLYPTIIKISISLII
jgi:hypothetical protein